jgi:hypothetical protein
MGGGDSGAGERDGGGGIRGVTDQGKTAGDAAGAGGSESEGEADLLAGVEGGGKGETGDGEARTGGRGLRNREGGRAGIGESERLGVRLANDDIPEMDGAGSDRDLRLRAGARLPRTAVGSGGGATGEGEEQKQQ